MKAITLLGVACLATILATSAHAAAIGDPAPPLTIERWVKGAPVKTGVGQNHLVVVEFWATWCPPCRKSIPHLTEVQKKFASKGVAIVGVSDETLAEVQPFVTSQGASMDYRVAIDSSKRMFKNWMTAYGQGGIPHAFIVGTNGTVLWHGYPSENLERALEEILTGQYDMKSARTFDLGDRLVEHYTLLVSKPNTATVAAPTGQKILTEYSEDWRIPHRLARAILTDPEIKSRDLPLALRASTKAVEMTQHHSADALAMHGRAQFANGKKSEGIATLKEALGIAQDPADKEEIQKAIALLEKAATMPAKPAAKK